MPSGTCFNCSCRLFVCPHRNLISPFKKIKITLILILTLTLNSAGQKLCGDQWMVIIPCFIVKIPELAKWYSRFLTKMFVLIMTFYTTFSIIFRFFYRQFKEKNLAVKEISIKLSAEYAVKVIYYRVVYR